MVPQALTLCARPPAQAVAVGLQMAQHQEQAMAEMAARPVAAAAAVALVQTLQKAVAAALVPVVKSGLWNTNKTHLQASPDLVR